jgi:hypothetical protein
MPVIGTDNKLDLIRLFYLLKSSESQAPNIKWFDQPFDRLTVLSKVEGLTTLSQVEGQIPMT